MGRHADLEMPDQTPPDLRFWVEGFIVVQGVNEAFRKKVNAARLILADLGLTPMDQIVHADNLSEAFRRRWTFKRVPLDVAHAILSEYEGGISYSRFRDEMYKEEPWTAAKQEAAMKKTQIVVHKLSKAGKLRKSYDEKTGNVILHLLGPKPLSGRPKIMHWEDLDEGLPPPWVDSVEDPKWLRDLVADQ